MKSLTQPRCRVCGCTDTDCRQCIAKTGEPCCWVERNLCSACYPGVELRKALDLQVAAGVLSQAESDEAYRVMDDLSDQELRGELSSQEAQLRIAQLGLDQVRRKAAS